MTQKYLIFWNESNSDKKPPSGRGIFQMKDLFDRWGMIIIVFLVIQKKQNSHNKYTCVVSIQFELDINIAKGTTDPRVKFCLPK